MKRFKEILFVIGLSFLFFATVQLTLSISKKPSVKQRIPIMQEANFELSAQPINLIKEIISTELFEVKNQAFLSSIITPRGELLSLKISLFPQINF